MDVSLLAKLILVASVFAPVLSYPIAYAVIPLDLAILADSFLAFAATRMLLPVTSLAPTWMPVLVLEAGGKASMEVIGIRDDLIVDVVGSISCFFTPSYKVVPTAVANLELSKP